MGQNVPGKLRAKKLDGKRPKAFGAGSLGTYRAKRNFKVTSEPAGRRVREAGSQFVIQKHAASHLHYDLRLEIDGVLKSWAIPKEIPLRAGERRLAVMVEDHPIEYGSFEGTIPKGQYGGGTVLLWDRGTFVVEGGDAARALCAGKLHFHLNGEKLSGEWALVRMRDDPKQGLPIKAGASVRPTSKGWELSVAGGKTIDELG